MKSRSVRIAPSLPLMPRRRARKKKSLAISGRTDAVAHPLAVDLSKADRTHGVRHVAIIMDGNGRWAKKRLLPRFAGHKAGEIGRAACRERVCKYVEIPGVGASLKKKKH